MYNAETIRKIDEFIGKEKEIVGHVVWNRKNKDKSSYVAKFPLSSNEQLIMDFDFESTAAASGKTNLQTGTLKILHLSDIEKEKILVCRMHIIPGNAHSNPRIKGCDVSGSTYPPNATRFYPWEDMKLLYASNLNKQRHIARIFDNVNNFQESLDFFLKYANIKGTIKLPEYENTLL